MSLKMAGFTSLNILQILMKINVLCVIELNQVETLFAQKFILKRVVFSSCYKTQHAKYYDEKKVNLKKYSGHTTKFLSLSRYGELPPIFEVF